MRRREFITLVAGAVGWSLTARAQQPGMPVVGFFHSGSAARFGHLVNAFRRGLTEAGYVEGRNVAIDYRWAEGRIDQLPTLVNGFVQREVAVIIATGGDNSVAVAKAATTKIPIVFTMGGDPVKLGIVDSINRPGRNLTGVNVMSFELGSKRLGLLHELVPAATDVALLVVPGNPNSEAEVTNVQAAANSLGLRLQILSASNERDLEVAFETLKQRASRALVVAADTFFMNRRNELVALAARHAIPAIYHQAEIPKAGGLMSYSPSLADAYRQVGIYAARILNGDKPANLPVVYPTKFELVINLRTAKALGLDVPPTLLARADEVIE